MRCTAAAIMVNRHMTCLLYPPRTGQPRLSCYSSYNDDITAQGGPKSPISGQIWLQKKHKHSIIWY